MKTTISDQALIAYESFFQTDDRWPENDEWSSVQPDFNHMIARLLVDIATNSSMGELTHQGIEHLSNILSNVDETYDLSYSTLQGKQIQVAEFKALPATETETIRSVSEAISFLMQMEPTEMLHYPESDERSEEHSHDWALGNLVIDDCADSLSYIGFEAYEYCEFAVALSMSAINASRDVISRILEIASRVVEVYEINKDSRQD